MDNTDMTNHPTPDRGKLLTERRSAHAADLDALPTARVLELINDQDQRIAAVVRAAIPAIEETVDTAARGLEAGGRLIYVGAGTSGRLGVLDASECPPTFHTDPSQVVGLIAGGDSALRQSSEGREDELDGAAEQLTELGLSENDTLIAIAAGGTTPYALGALRFARQRRAATALVACVDASQLPELARQHAQVRICLPVGPELITGSTRMKAGTATKLALNMISTGIMIQLGKVWGDLMVDLRATNAKLRDRAARILTSQTDLSRDRALKLLSEADLRVKPALVMARLSVNLAEADRLLEEHRGRLRPLLGPPRTG